MRRLALLLVPLLLVACDRAPVSPDVTPDFGGNGATVYTETSYMHTARVTWMDNDPATEGPDILLLGYEPSEDPVCNDGEWGGAGVLVRDHMTFTQTDEGFSLYDQSTWGGVGVHDVFRIIGRAPMYMYHWADVPGGSNEEICDFITNDWIASGTWTATLVRDNDVTGGDATPGRNTFGQTENGVLWGPDGSMYKYEWKYTVHYLPENPPGERFVVRNSVDHVVRIK